MNKQEFMNWNRFVSFVSKNYMNNQGITLNMAEQIKGLQEYVNSFLPADEKMGYDELLELLQQSKSIIDEISKEKSNVSDDERFADVCKGVRKYLQMIMGVTDECRVIQYCGQAGYTKNISITMSKEAVDAYNAKMDEIKEREDVNKYREFTRIGAFSTYVLAVAKGLIDFKKYGEQIYLVSKDGYLGTELEIDSLEKK